MHPEDRAAAAAALRSIARDEELKRFVQETDRVYEGLLGAARRFIGGETLEECMQTADEVNGEGHAVTIDYMGVGLMSERGYDTRVYLPYGTEWYLYLCHRIAEYPPNLYRAVGDVVGEAQRDR